MANILILHGPNLNLLGSREPGVYGSSTLDEINQQLDTLASSAQVSLDKLQSNAEHVLIDRIQASGSDGTQFIIINPGGFTHTSVAMRDALLAVALPFIEVHLSNVHSREAFRRQSYFSDIATGVICGMGPMGYEFALRAAIDALPAPTSQD